MMIMVVVAVPVKRSSRSKSAASIGFYSFYHISGVSCSFFFFEYINIYIFLCSVFDKRKIGLQANDKSESELLKQGHACQGAASSHFWWPCPACGGPNAVSVPDASAGPLAARHCVCCA